MKKTNMEFSKKIFYMVTVFTLSVVIYSMVLMWKTNDASALSYLIPSVFVEFGVATGFYYNKAKVENEIKLSKHYKSDYMSDEESEEMEE